jgi:ribosome-associated toxin RatA of RatAB toxin-antitoxin module
MRQISFSAEVHAQFETLWELLLDRVEHSKEYLPGAEDVRIIERHDDFLVQEVRAHGLVLKEEVTVDKGKGEIRYMLLEHPLFSGTVTQRAVPASR